MEPWPYKSDFQRQKQILFERYMRQRQNDVYDSGNERYQWVEVAAKNRYRPEVKVNNWMEEQRDVDYLKHRRPLAGDFDYAYKTEYLTRYGDVAGRRITPSGREPRVFPGHQPELDLPPLKRVYNSHETTHRVAYQDPGLATDVKKQSPCIYCRINAGHFGR